MAATGSQPLPAGRPPVDIRPPVPARSGRGFSIAAGVIYIIAGIFSIAFPFIASLATTLVIGWLFVFVGIVAIVHAFGVKGWRGALWNGFVGLILVVGGGLIIAEPLVGTLSLTALLAGILIVEGVVEIFAAFSMRDRSNWGWVLLSGFVALAAGLSIAFQLPSSALWVLGLLVGIKLIFSGVSYITDRHDDVVVVAAAPPPMGR